MTQHTNNSTRKALETLIEKVEQGTADYSALEEARKIMFVQSEEQFDADQTALLKASIELETTKKQLRELTMDYASTFVFLGKFLDEIEGAFDREKKFASAEICLDYLAAAKFMEERGRKDNYIVAAQMWYDEN